MCDPICGVACGKCGLRETCGGCAKTNGRPFGGKCIVAECARGRGCERIGSCADGACELKERLIAEFNALGIGDMARVTDLNALRGAFVNLEYVLSNGQAVKLLDDDRIYLGNQLRKAGSERCYGLAADERYLLVCEYGSGGADAEIVVYKKRKV